MRILALFIAMFCSTLAHADLGGCVVYKVKYVMKDGQTITGLLPIWSYEDYSYLNDSTNTNRYCDDLEFQKLINRIFYKYKKTLYFNIYKQIHLVNFGESAHQKGSASPRVCAFADSISFVQLNLDSIKYTVFINAKNADWEYTETSIQLFDTETCQMMKDKAVLNHTYLSHESVPESANYVHEFEFYFVLNYNKEISLVELNKMMESISPRFYQPELNRIHSVKKSADEDFNAEKKRVIEPILLELRRKGIVLFQVHSTC